MLVKETVWCNWGIFGVDEGEDVLDEWCQLDALTVYWSADTQKTSSQDKGMRVVPSGVMLLESYEGELGAFKNVGV